MTHSFYYFFHLEHAITRTLRTRIKQLFEESTKTSCVSQHDALCEFWHLLEFFQTSLKFKFFPPVWQYLLSFYDRLLILIDQGVIYILKKTIEMKTKVKR